MIPELNHIECITLFTEDLSLTRKFYEDLFAGNLIFEDPNCAVIEIGNIMINILKISESPELITPAKVGDQNTGARMMFTVKVQNVDAVCEKLKKHGASLLNGPIDRPWGRRTATFNDPAGNAWEIAQEI